MAGLLIVLAVGILPFIVVSTLHAFGVSGASSSITPPYMYYRTLLTQVTSLALLSYVLYQNGQTLAEIGLTFRLGDFGHGVLLIIAASGLARFVKLVILALYELTSGHAPWPPTLPFSGLSFSLWLLAFSLLNPFFEELIVRAFLISETIAISASATVAVAFSLAVQTSYHLYQGLPNAVALAAVFLVFSLYYVRTRRAFPIIFAHLWSDMSYLVFHFRLGHF
jgi:membrane protease YdiL (CAAX protease family)